MTYDPSGRSGHLVEHHRVVHALILCHLCIERQYVATCHTGCWQPPSCTTTWGGLVPVLYMYQKAVTAMAVMRAMWVTTPASGAGHCDIAFLAVNAAAMGQAASTANSYRTSLFCDPFAIVAN
jgi:hypothetical protein